jgi:hypothetical protein
MAELFRASKQNISLRIRDHFEEKELHKATVVKAY